MKLPCVYARVLLLFYISVFLFVALLAKLKVYPKISFCAGAVTSRFDPIGLEATGSRGRSNFPFVIGAFIVMSRIFRELNYFINVLLDDRPDRI